MAWTPIADLTGPQGEAGEAVVLGGVVDCSAMTTAAQVNAASLAAPEGSEIWLGARGPDAPLTIETTIVLRPRQSVIGLGGRAQLTCIKAGSSFPAGAPMLAAQGFLDNATVADAPIRVVGVDLDASSKTGSHGLVVYNFWSHFEDIQVSNVDGLDAHGIHVTDRSANGTNISTNSHSENTFTACRFYDHTGNATAFFAESNNGESNQDGHLLDAWLASISGDGVRITRAAGWSIENSHFYGIGFSAIALGNCYATKVLRNYVEDFGGDDGANNGADPTYGYYNGIALETVLDTRASIVALNTVSAHQPSSPTGNQWTCYAVRAGWGQSRANVVMVGNTATWAIDEEPVTSRTWAYRLGEGGDPVSGESPARMLHVEWAGNQVEALDWWAGVRYVEDDTVTITEPGGDAEPPDLSGYVTTTTDQTVGGIKTVASGSANQWIFNQPPQVPVGSLAYHAVRRDDARLTDARTPTSHNHVAGDVNSGTFAIARIPTGTSGTTVPLGNDARFSDARAPTAHTQGQDTITAAPRTITYGTALTALTAASGVALDVVTCTLTGNPTITPVAGDARQVIRLGLIAGSSARTVTFATAVRTGTGIADRTVSIPANQVAVIGLEFFVGLSPDAWVMFSEWVSS